MHSKYIKFYAFYSRHYGKNSALILSQLDYWYSKCSLETHPDGFYKFLKPCNHRDYRQGDSWLEELDLHPKSFYRAFKNIGVHYDSRTMFEEAFKEPGYDVFQGMPWLKIYDRYSNKTYFLKNPEFVKEKAYSADDLICLKNDPRRKILSAHQQNRPKSLKKSLKTTEILESQAHDQVITQKNIIVNKKKTIKSKNLYKNLYKEQAESTDNPQCPLGIGQNVLSRHYISEITTELSHAGAREIKNKKIDRTAENLQRAEEMVKAWNYETNDSIEVDDRQIAFLLQALKDKFEGSLNKWRDFCKRIGLSKFLMSKRSTWFCFDWVLIFRNMEKILRGKLGWDAPPIVSLEYQDKLKKKNDQLILEEANPRLKVFKNKLRERLGDGKFNYLVKESSFEETRDGGVILKVSYHEANRISFAFDDQRAFSEVVDDLRISCFKVVGPSCSDPSHRYHDPKRVHFEYLERKCIEEENNYISNQHIFAF